MGFKLPGKSMTSGTSAHSSALKMKAEADTASALKKTYKTAYTEDTDKGKATREKYKTQEDFNKAADDWWKSDAGQKKASTKGSKFAHRIIKKEAPVTEDKTKLTKTQNVVAKGDKKISEVKENVSKKTAKIAKRDARKKYGRGSKEHLAAKQAHLKAKEADRQGTEGGKKQGIFRKASSKINLKRQKKTQAKIDAMETEKDSPAKFGVVGKMAKKGIKKGEQILKDTGKAMAKGRKFTDDETDALRNQGAEPVNEPTTRVKIKTKKTKFEKDRAEKKSRKAGESKFQADVRRRKEK